MKNLQDLLNEIAAIRTMERGTLCRMRSGPYFNHQTWQQGKNRVRYVPQSEAATLRNAINGYRRFLALTQQYADQIIRRSRAERKAASLTRRTAKPRN